MADSAGALGVFQRRIADHPHMGGFPVLSGGVTAVAFITIPAAVYGVVSKFGIDLHLLVYRNLRYRTTSPLSCAVSFSSPFLGKGIGFEVSLDHGKVQMTFRTGGGQFPLEQDVRGGLRLRFYQDMLCLAGFVAIDLNDYGVFTFRNLGQHVGSLIISGGGN